MRATECWFLVTAKAHNLEKNLFYFIAWDLVSMNLSEDNLNGGITICLDTYCETNPLALEQDIYSLAHYLSKM